MCAFAIIYVVHLFNGGWQAASTKASNKSNVAAADVSKDDKDMYVDVDVDVDVVVDVARRNDIIYMPCRRTGHSHNDAHMATYYYNGQHRTQDPTQEE